MHLKCYFSGVGASYVRNIRKNISHNIFERFTYRKLYIQLPQPSKGLVRSKWLNYFILTTLTSHRTKNWIDVTNARGTQTEVGSMWWSTRLLKLVSSSKSSPNIVVFASSSTQVFFTDLHHSVKHFCLFSSESQITWYTKKTSKQSQGEGWETFLILSD